MLFMESENDPIYLKQLFFPTQDMMMVFLEKFGRFITFQESMDIIKSYEAALDLTIDQEITTDQSLMCEILAPKPKRIIKRVESNNFSFIASLEARKCRVPNFVELNAKRNFVYTPLYQASRETNVFNYSGQKLSSVDMQIREKKADLAKRKRDKLLAFGTEFLSSIPFQ